MKGDYCTVCGGRLYSDVSIERGECLSCRDFDYDKFPSAESFDGEDVDVELGEER